MQNITNYVNKNNISKNINCAHSDYDTYHDFHLLIKDNNQIKQHINYLNDICSEKWG